MKLPKDITTAIKQATDLRERQQKLQAALEQQHKVAADAKATLKAAEAELADIEAAALVGEAEPKALEAARKKYDDAYRAHGRAPAVVDGLESRLDEVAEQAEEIEQRLQHVLHDFAEKQLDALKPRFEEAAATIREIRDVLVVLEGRANHGGAAHAARQWSLTDLNGDRNLLLDNVYVPDGGPDAERMPAWTQTPAAVAISDALTEAAELRRTLHFFARRRRERTERRAAVDREAA